MNEIERLQTIERAAFLAYEHYLTAYDPNSDFDAEVQLALMDELGNALNQPRRNGPRHAGRHSAAPRARTDQRTDRVLDKPG